MGAYIWIVVLAIAVIALIAVWILRQRRGGAAKPAEVSADEARALADALLKAVGGAENIASVEHCTTRVRFELKRYAAVNEAAAKEAGALSVVRTAKNTCQIQVGASAPQVYAELKKLI